MNTKSNYPAFANPTAKCSFCGHEGKYPKEVMDIDYLDHAGHETVITACRDTDECFARGGKNKPIYY